MPGYGPSWRALRVPVQLLVLAVMLAGLVSTSARAQSIAPPYDASYSLSDVGSPPGVPGPLGGLTIKDTDTSKLLIGGQANLSVGALYEVTVTRDLAGHITGFDGTATTYADAAYNDGGVAYGPGGVLFLARWPDNKLGETKPGSSITDKIVDVGAMGVASSLSSVRFVPAGFPGAGSFKLASYGGGQFYDADVVPDGSGTYDLINLAQVVASTLSGGPEGFVYIPSGNPGFVAPGMLVAEYAAGTVAAYDALDADGNPVTASRKNFITGLSGAEGATIDPVTGDFLFSTFGGGDRVIVVKGFAAPTEGPAGDPTCSDSLDNDGDGDTDSADSDCQFPPEGPAGDATCSDGIDNDGDSNVDQADADCQSPEGPPGDPSCSDGIDNDGDGDVDIADSACQAVPSEGPAGDPSCSDGIDNDGDLLVDQLDPECQSPEGPTGDPSCSDGIDNDGDGNVDGSDPDCVPPPPNPCKSSGAITGTNGNDNITGTPGNDIICAKKGNDVVHGLGGDDIIIGAEGNDQLYGEGDNDDLRAGLGADRVFAGDGNDVVHAGADNDRVDGGDGDDVIHCDGGDDYVAPRQGNDRVSGDRGNDRLNGGVGNDVVSGGGGDDVIDGSGGDDTLDGGSGNDSLAAGPGVDLVKGGADDDHINSVDNRADTVKCNTGTDSADVDALDSVSGCEATTVH